MTLWAIVPVKPLRRGKSRLSQVLSPQERIDLNRHLLTHTLDTLRGISEIEQVLVVSRDQAALSLARSFGARTVQEYGAPRLNIALTRATILAKSYSTKGILIIPADLPLVSPEDIRSMLEKSKNPPVVVLAPDIRREGTNAMIVNPIGLIEYEFGPNSFERHCASAKKAGARLEICELSSIALDMDIPEDLDLVGENLQSILSSIDGE